MIMTMTMGPLRQIATMLLWFALTQLIFATSDPDLSSNTTIPTTDTYSCTNPEPNTCTFYNTCLEARYHCGADGYPLGYGYKYCTAFSRQRSKLSAAGQEWMVEVMHCLQEKLVLFIDESRNASCDELKDYAFSTHPGCYVSSGAGGGFCTLGVEDWDAVLEIVGVETLVESVDAVAATLETAGECAEFYLWAVEREVL